MEKATREEVFLLHAQICKALADPSRLLIIVELRHHPRTVGELARAIGATQPLTSRHLGVLREKGIVRAEREGSYVRYRLADRRVFTAIALLLEVLGSQLTHQGAAGTAVRRLRPVLRSAS